MRPGCSVSPLTISISKGSCDFDELTGEDGPGIIRILSRNVCQLSFVYQHEAKFGTNRMFIHDERALQVLVTLSISSAGSDWQSQNRSHICKTPEGLSPLGCLGCLVWSACSDGLSHIKPSGVEYNSAEDGGDLPCSGGTVVDHTRNGFASQANMLYLTVTGRSSTLMVVHEALQVCHLLAAWRHSTSYTRGAQGSTCQMHSA